MAHRRLTSTLMITVAALLAGCSAQARVGHTQPPSTATTQTVVVVTPPPPQLTEADRMRIMVDQLRHSNAPWLADDPDRSKLIGIAHIFCDSDLSYDEAARRVVNFGGSWAEAHALLDAAMTAFCPTRPIGQTSDSGA